MIGLSKSAVRVVEYDPCWPDWFRQEASRLRDALGSAIQEIEHVGSTSIPGLNAKPIIDMLATVENLECARELVPIFEHLGYEYLRDDPVPGRLFFALGPPTHRTHHLSLISVGSVCWHQQMAFRDYLRGNPVAAADYVVLKQRLAAQFANDRVAYTAAKNDFISSVLASLQRQS